MNATDPHDPIDPLRPLRDFVRGMTRLVERTADERTIIVEGRGLLSALLADDRWLPDAYAQANAGEYRQYLLHCDPLERFSVVSFAWGPGARTPVHDHTVWGLVGILRGAESCREYAPDDGPSGRRVVDGGREHRMEPGAIEAVSPSVGDWHVVSNAMPDRTSVSVHVYGANIGAVRRHMVDPKTGAIADFVSGYSAPSVPNLWDRAPSVRAAIAAGAPSR
jgi:predicted metal-dependent enzyme (double-stranded beta helix superfamily)